MILRYEAADGTLLDSAEDCRAYEIEHPELLLVGLTLNQLRAAIARTDVDLAYALETIGAAIARGRRAHGELRRERRTPAAEPLPLAIAGPLALEASETPTPEPDSSDEPDPEFPPDYEPQNYNERVA